MSKLETEGLLNGLLVWLNSLQLPCGPASLEDVATGRPLHDALRLMDPGHFEAEWARKFVWDGVHDPDNWRVRASNIRKIVMSLTEYYEKVLKKNVERIPSINVNEVAQGNSAEDLALLLQLLVSAALSCPLQKELVSEVMGLEQCVQSAVMTAMTAINELTDQGASPVAAASPPSSSRAASAELAEAKAKLAEAERKIAELDQQVWSLNDEKAERVSRGGGEAAGLDEAVRKAAALQASNETYQAQLQHTEAAAQEAASRAEKVAKENEELKLRLAELRDMETRYRGLKDEVDELKLNAAKYKTLETTVDTLRRKLEDSRDLKTQVNMLEQKNTAYMSSVILLEEEQRKNATLKIQLEALNKASVEQDERVMLEAKRADKATFEAAKATERLTAAKAETERLTEVLRQAEERREEALGEDLSASMASASSELSGIFSAGGDVASVRLELETTKERLDAMEGRKTELETEVRVSGQRVRELEARVAALTELAGQGAESEKGRLQSLHAQSEAAGLKSGRLAEKLREAEVAAAKQDEDQRRLETELKATAAKLASTEVEYKTNMEKARTVIAALEKAGGPGGRYSRTSSSVSTGGGEGVEALRKELERKERDLERVTEELERLRVMGEQEQRLITTAWYDKAIELQRAAGAERLVSSSSHLPQSFLAQQRAVSSSASTRQSPGLSAFAANSARVLGWCVTLVLMLVAAVVGVSALGVGPPRLETPLLEHDLFRPFHSFRAQFQRHANAGSPPV